MNFQKRKQSILKRLAEAGEADIKQLATVLGVAEITIRRDLNHLAADGLLQRTHGGAIKPRGAHPTHPFLSPTRRPSTSKQKRPSPAALPQPSTTAKSSSSIAVAPSFTFAPL